MARSLDKIFQETKETYCAQWAEESAKLRAARRYRGIDEVVADDKDYFKVIADARLRLEKDTASATPSIEQNDSRNFN